MRAYALPPALGVGVVCLGTLVVPFDSAVNVAFPAIIRAFSLPIPAIQWVVIAYTLTYAALMLVFGRLGDMLGHRRVFLLGTGCSTVAFLVCAAASSLPWLLAARVAQGVGAALALSCGPALATWLYPESQRSRILGLYTMIFGVGGAAGSLLAGVLVQRFGWQAVFWFRAPIALVSLVFAKGLTSAARTEGRDRFDVPGAVLLALGLTSLLLGITATSRLGAGDYLAVLPLGIAAASLAAFIWWEGRAAQPIVRIDLFRDRGFAAINLVNALLNLCAF
jgi:MFS family permease